MTLASILHTTQSLGFMTQLRESALVYPIILATHLACIAVFGGLILMTDMRLLGFALRDYTITEVVTGLRPWKRLGGTLMICMGLLLFGSEADKYYPNPYFWTKMTLLALIGVHALVFRPLVYNRTEELDRAAVLPAAAKAAAWLSVILWFGVLTMGRLIAYWE